jgi:CHAT domain-containing protein/tetratricopeptide (TPR) repeat protein
LGEEHLSYANSLNNLAFLYYSMGDYARAEPLYRQASEIWKKLLGASHPEYATSLNNLALLYYSMGDYVRAEPLYRLVLEIKKKTLGEDHPDYAIGLNNLALLYKSMGGYARAEPLYRQALEIKKKAFGESHIEYATSLDNLAGLYDLMGNYTRAEPLLRKALDIRKKALGENHPDYAFSLNNLAFLYTSMGDYAKAEPLYRQALEIRKKALGENHPDYAFSLNNLAFLYNSMGDYAKAEPLYQQAIEIRKKVLGENNADYAASLNNLASLYSSMGDYVRAEPLCRQASGILKKALGENHPDFATGLNNLARLYQLMGDYARAEPLYEKALQIRKKALGMNHPDYALSLNNLAMLYQSMGDYAKATPLYRQAVDIDRRNLDLAAGVQSERQQLAMSRSLRYVLDNYLSTAVSAHEKADLVYGQVLLWKGAVCARQERQRLQRQRPDLAPDFAKLEVLAGELAKLSFSAPNPSRAAAWHQRIRELSDEKELLEGRLSASSIEYARLKTTKRIDPATLAASLPSDVALVDFLEHWSERSPGTQKKAQRERRLATFVVRRDSIVQLDLGAVEPISQAIELWHKNLGRGTIGPGEPDPGVTLRQLVWQPLVPLLKGASTVLVSPDGALNRFPLCALPGKVSGSYLIEDLAIATVPVPQLLPEFLSKAPPGSVAQDSSLLLVGDVDYGQAPSGKEIYRGLSGTAGEISVAREQFERRFPGGKVIERKGTAATKEAIERELAQHPWVHLATHGFFDDREAQSTLVAEARLNPSRMGIGSDRESMTPVGVDPGLLSGIVLAGANCPTPEDPRRGILTALEVAQMDLHNVDTAVLSACVTGRGKESAGEGVLGLQRAFQVSGARTVIASLWPVPDRQTCELMQGFYQNLWRKSDRPMSKLEALRQAQLTLLHAARAPTSEVKRGEVPAEPPSTNPTQKLPPEYWAAFVLSGDWR